MSEQLSLFGEENTLFNEGIERLEELEADEMLGSNPLNWFAVISQLNGFFEKRFFKGLEELKEWLQHYMKPVKAYGKNP